MKKIKCKVSWGISGQGGFYGRFRYCTAQQENAALGSATTRFIGTPSLVLHHTSSKFCRLLSSVIKFNEITILLTEIITKNFFYSSYRFLTQILTNFEHEKRKTDILMAV